MPKIHRPKTRRGTVPRGLKRFAAYLQEEQNELKRKMLFTGYFFDRLSKRGVKAFIVGGMAVEIFTAGQFATGDIDITVTDRGEAEKILAEMGFTQIGRIWLNEDLRVAVDIVAAYPSRAEKTRVIEVADFKVNVEGVEDLIIDRLTAAKYWRSNPKLDIEQAAVLFAAFKDGLDLRYLRERAAEERVDDYLREIEGVT